MAVHKRLTSTELFAEPDAARYDLWHSDIWHRVINAHHTVLTLEHLAGYPLDRVSTRSEGVFWRTIAQNSRHAVVTTLYGLVDDEAQDALTINRLRDFMMTVEWRVPEAKKSFRDALREARNNRPTEPLREKAKNLRHRYFAHRFFNPETGTIRSAATIMDITELRQLFDRVEDLFQVCSVGSYYQTTTMDYSPTTYGPNGKEKLGVETILDTIGRHSYFVNQPETRAQWWPDLKRHKNQEEMEALNELRSRYGLAPA